MGDAVDRAKRPVAMVPDMALAILDGSKTQTRRPVTPQPRRGCAVSGFVSGAIISPSGKYRYQLTREWDAGSTFATFVMLNPSTADAAQDDPTIRKCVGFAQRWGHGGIRVVNLFAYRTPYPTELVKAADDGVPIIGPENREAMADAIERSGALICAWGKPSSVKLRRLIGGCIPPCLRDAVDRAQVLGTTSDGWPRHPLMMPYASALQPWTPTPTRTP